MALLAAIGILAGASVAYEILLTRLFSILLWHHFAYMIISVALLGIGASGTFLAFAREMLTARFTEAFAGCAIQSAGGHLGSRSAAPSRADLWAPGAAILSGWDSYRTGLHCLRKPDRCNLSRRPDWRRVGHASYQRAAIYPPATGLSACCSWARCHRRIARGLGRQASPVGSRHCRSRGDLGGSLAQFVAGAATVALQGHEHRAHSARCAGFNRAVESNCKHH